MSPKAVQRAGQREGASAPRRSPTSSRSSRQPRAVWLMVPAAVVDDTIADLLPLLEAGRHPHRRRQLLLRRRHPARQGARRRRASTTWTCGTSGGVWGLERGYCLMIGGETEVVKHLDPIFATLAPGAGDVAAHAGPREARRHGRAGLPALRPERRRPLRQDGPQRHRVRPHGRLRRGPEHPAHANVGKQEHEVDAETTPLRDPEHYQYDFNLRRHRRGLAARQRRRLLAARPDGRRAGRGSGARGASPAASRIRARAAGRSRRPSTRRVPAPVLTTALYERFSSRGDLVVAPGRRGLRMARRAARRRSCPGPLGWRGGGLDVAAREGVALQRLRQEQCLGEAALGCAACAAAPSRRLRPGRRTRAPGRPTSHSSPSVIARCGPALRQLAPRPCRHCPGTKASRYTRWRTRSPMCSSAPRDDEAAIGKAQQHDVLQVLVQHLVDHVAHMRAQVHQRAGQAHALAHAGEAGREPPRGRRPCSRRRSCRKPRSLPQAPWTRTKVLMTSSSGSMFKRAPQSAPASREAVHEVRQGPLRLAHHLDAREALQDLLPQDPQLQLGQPVAHAAVDAEAERQVLARPGAVDDEASASLDRRARRGCPTRTTSPPCRPCGSCLPPSSVSPARCGACAPAASASG